MRYYGLNDDMSYSRRLCLKALDCVLWGALKTRDWKTRNWKTRHQITGVENAGPENGEPQSYGKPSL